MTTKFDIRQSISRDNLDQLATAANKEVDDLLRSINSELTMPLRMTANTSLVVSIGPLLLTNPEHNRKRSIPPISNLIPSFVSGTVTVGATGAGNATPSVGLPIALGMSASQYMKIGVHLNALGQLVLTAGATAANELSAPAPAVPNNTYAIGFFLVQTDPSNNVANITSVHINQYVGSGTGGSGSGSGGSGEKNYIENPSAAFAITESISGWFNVGDLDVARTTTLSELPREFTTGSGIKITSDPNAQSVADYVYYDFTLDDVDLNKKLKIQWSQKQFGAYVAGNLAVVITTQADRTTAIATPDVTAIPAYDGVFTASFDTASTATLSLVIRATADMATDAGLVISDVIVGPGMIQTTPAIGPWVDAGAFDVWNENGEVILSKGLTAYDKLVWRRVGSSMEIRYNLWMTSGGQYGDGRNYIKIPEGLTADLTKLNTASSASSSAVIGKATIKIDFSWHEGHTYIHNDGSGTRIGAFSWEADFDRPQEISILATIPIAEWAGAPNYAGQNDVEYAWNSSGVTAAGASNTTAFAYGPQGVAIGSIASTTVTQSFTTMRVRFLTPVQETDSVFIQFSNSVAGGWFMAQDTGLQFARQGTATYGVAVTKYGLNNTDVDVFFGNAGMSNTNVTYGAAGQAWGANYRWRLVKVRAGAAVGFGAATTTRSGLVDTGTQSFAGNKTFTGNVALGGLRVGIATESGGAGTYTPDVSNVGAYVFGGTGAKTVNTINGGVDGKVLFIIQQSNTGNSLLLTNAGNIRTASGATVTIVNNGGMTLVYQNGGWQEISSGV